jgi:photosystem II stability/assembly factor-like uncharacterized protein
LDPTNSEIVYAAIRPGLFKTTDGGDSWQKLDLPMPYKYYGSVAIDIDPNDRDVVTVADSRGEGIYQSTDGGQLWSQLNSDYLPSVESLAFSQDDRDRVIASTRLDGVTRFHVSSDGGVSWDSGGPYLDSDQILSLGEGLMLSTGSYYGAIKSLNAGESWSELRVDCPIQDLEDQWVYSLSEAQSGGVYAASNQGVYYISSDLESCSLISQGMLSEYQQDRVVKPYSLAADPVDAGVLYVGTLYDGIFKTHDVGQSWIRASDGIKAAEIQSIASHPENSNLIFAGGMGFPTSASDSLWVSEDAGRTWQVKSQGLNLPGVQAISIDSGGSSDLASSHLFAVGRGAVVLDGQWIDHSGVFKSEDGGSSWFESGQGVEVIPEELAHRVIFGPPPDSERHAVIIDQNGLRDASGYAQTVYVSGTALSQETANGCTMTGHRIYKSLDAGESWFPADTGIPASCPEDGVVQVRDILIDPSDSNVLYAGTYVHREFFFLDASYPENGVFKSTDGGANWHLKSSGIPIMGGEASEGHWDINALAIAQSDPQTLFAVAEEAYEHYVGEEGTVVTRWYPSVVFKSSDGGESWVQANEGIPSEAQIHAVEVNPKNEDVAYVSTRSSSPGLPDVFRTTDGGASWQPYGEVEKIAGAMRLHLGDAEDDVVLYVGGLGGVFRSESSEVQ